MAKEICHDTISSVATQETEYRRRAMLRQKIACRDKTGEECNKLAEIRKVNVVTRFVSWMSAPRRTCREKKKGSYRDTGNRKKSKILSQRGILCCDKKLKSNTGRILRHISLCCDIIDRSKA